MELLLSSKTVSLASITVTIVSAGRPRTVINYANEAREEPFGAMAEPGYYQDEWKEFPRVETRVCYRKPC